jgi:hypothetical protein
MPGIAKPVRITRDREFGGGYEDRLKMQVNVHGLKTLQAGITGDAIAQILMDALEPAEISARADWPVDTGASIDSIERELVEVGERHARAVLQIGGPKLLADPRNRSRKDYAPFVEFNGSPAGRGQGVMARSFYNNEKTMKQIIHNEIASLIAELTR